MTLRKEIEERLGNPYYSDDDDCLDQICALVKERLEKANKEVKLLKSYFEDRWSVELPKNDIKWKDIELDTFITELSGRE